MDPDYTRRLKTGFFGFTFFEIVKENFYIFKVKVSRYDVVSQVFVVY